MKRFFLTGTSTDVGKTTVAVALLRHWRDRGETTLGLKPVETGVVEAELNGAATASDAAALARVSSAAVPGERPEWYRARQPASPVTVAIHGGPPAPMASALVAGIDASVAHAATASVVVEGAGGLMVPLNATETFLDLAKALAWPLVVVAPDALGVQSDVLLLAEVAAHHGLSLGAVVLNGFAMPLASVDALHNRSVLAARVPCPVVPFRPAALTEDAMGQAVLPLASSLEG